MKQSYDIGQRNLVSQQDAAYIENAQIPRGKFHNQWTRKGAMQAGVCYPILVDEVLPGDHLTYEMSAYIRMQTPLFPMFDNMRVDTHFFFVPNRLVWTNWVKLMGEQENPGDSIAYTVPQIVSALGGDEQGGLADHMGIPVNGQIDPTGIIIYSALPFRMWNKIYNEWFRDENVDNARATITGDGPDSPSSFYLFRRNKSHDYFTSALPWPQKFTSPLLPMAGLAPVTGIGTANQSFPIPGPVSYYETQGLTEWNWSKGPIDGATANQNVFIKGESNTGNPAIYADLSQATGATINQLRQAFMIQSLLERDARGGTRYTEKIRSQFGVVNPDFRLQRSEYIGGGQSPVNITPIAQTAPTTGVPLGALGGAGTAAGTHRASYAATEHGYIIGIISVKSELSYQQGLARHWSRYTQYDFYVPALAQLGEQAIYRKELYCKGTAFDNQVFGYQERWMEYRTKYSEVVHKMRSTASGTLDAWHLAQNFTTTPSLNTTFLGDTPPMHRILAGGVEASEEAFLYDLMFRRTAVRPIPTFGTPATLGRF